MSAAPELSIIMPVFNEQGSDENKQDCESDQGALEASDRRFDTAVNQYTTGPFAQKKRRNLQEHRGDQCREESLPLPMG